MGRGASLGVLFAWALIGCSSTGPEPVATPPASSALVSGAAPAVSASASPPLVVASPPKKPGWDPKKTYALVVGVLTFEDPKIASFSDVHRKDEELAGTLLARGVPADHLVLLLDRDATSAAVFSALEKLAKSAPKDATLLVYYAGHGDKAENGAISFVPWDAAAKKPEQSLPLSRIQSVIASGFAGDTVLLLADCCFSGGLVEVASALRKGGKRALALTSAESSNTSTENWTYTQILIDDLLGDALADHDADGTIGLSEVVDEERDAMKFREKQRAGASIDGFDPGWVLSERRGPAVRLGGDEKLGAYVEAARKSTWDVARIVGAEGANRQVQFYDYSDKDTVPIAASSTRPISFTRYPVGEKLQVFWGGKQWKAEVTRVDGDFSFITYPGWPAFWDEWILSDRVASVGPPLRKGEVASFAKDEGVKVVWRGKLWDAHILEVKGGRYLVRYDGYDASWDEWVGKARLKKR